MHSHFCLLSSSLFGVVWINGCPWNQRRRAGWLTSWEAVLHTVGRALMSQIDERGGGGGI